MTEKQMENAKAEQEKAERAKAEREEALLAAGASAC